MLLFCLRRSYLSWPQRVLASFPIDSCTTSACLIPCHSCSWLIQAYTIYLSTCLPAMRRHSLPCNQSEHFFYACSSSLFESLKVSCVSLRRYIQTSSLSSLRLLDQDKHPEQSESCELDVRMLLPSCWLRLRLAAAGYADLGWMWVDCGGQWGVIGCR